MYYVSSLDTVNLDKVRKEPRLFEVLVRDCANLTLRGNYKLVRDCSNLTLGGNYELYGGNGEKQFGVDIIPADGKNLIQCKCYNGTKRAIKKLFKAEIEKGYGEAVKHFPKMEKYIVATTLDRSRDWQDIVRGIEQGVGIEL